MVSDLSLMSPYLSPVFARPLRSAPSLPALLSFLLSQLQEAKAEEVVTLNVEGKTSLADIFLIATGTSSIHVKSISERIVRACKDIGLSARVEGVPHYNWIIVDLGDVILHIFREEVRLFYNLEKIWSQDMSEKGLKSSSIEPICTTSSLPDTKETGYCNSP